MNDLLYKLAKSIGIKIVPMSKDGSNAYCSQIINVEMSDEHSKIIRSKGYIGGEN